MYIVNRLCFFNNAITYIGIVINEYQREREIQKEKKGRKKGTHSFYHSAIVPNKYS